MSNSGFQPTRNFGITRKGVAIAAAAASAAAVIDANAQFADVLIYNPGPFTVYVLAGDAGAVADATCMPILSGEKAPYFKGAATHLATYSPSGAQGITAFPGDGL